MAITKIKVTSKIVILVTRIDRKTKVSEINIWSSSNNLLLTVKQN